MMINTLNNLEKIDNEQRDCLREFEIESAWREVKEDIKSGRFKRERAIEHFARIKIEIGTHGDVY